MFKKVSIYALLAIFVCLVFLYFGLLTNKNYGITWDFPHHFNAGLRRLNLPAEAPHLGNLPYGPLSDSLPVLSYLYFYKNLDILPFDEAYHLPIVVFGSIGILVCFFLGKEVFNEKAGLLAAVILALYPRYIGHSHNNMKDVFSGVMFALSILSYLWAFKAKTVKKKFLLYILAGVIWGVGFNFKINIVLVPVVIVIHQGFLFIRKKQDKLKFLFSYVGASVLSAYFVWSFFWEKPGEKLIYLFSYFQGVNEGFVNLYFGKIYNVGLNVPWHVGLGTAFVVTPVFFVFLFLIGFGKVIWQSIKGSAYISFVLVSWFFVSALKYIYPKIGIVDDIRQYYEIVFPLAIIAGCGGWTIYSFFRRFVGDKLYWLFYLVLIVYGFWQLVPVRGYETSYFNEFVGGLKGTNNKFDVEFWGHSFKEASLWLNGKAKTNAIIYTPLAGHLLKYYCRDDIKVIEAPFKSGSKEMAESADYIVLLNRQSFFDQYDKDIPYYLTNKKVVYKIERTGVPLVWVFKN